jgi:hypothetical protein
VQRGIANQAGVMAFLSNMKSARAADACRTDAIKCFCDQSCRERIVALASGGTYCSGQAIYSPDRDRMSHLSFRKRLK